MLYPRIFRNDLFDDMFDDFIKPSAPNMMPAGFMKTDIKENESAYTLEIELPGMKKENVTVELKDGALEIKASSETDSSNKDEKGRYLRRERFYGSCSRTFYVGEEVTREDIRAKFEDGILTLTVPKKEALPKTETKQLISIE